MTCICACCARIAGRHAQNVSARAARWKRELETRRRKRQLNRSNSRQTTRRTTPTYTSAQHVARMQRQTQDGLRIRLLIRSCRIRCRVYHAGQNPRVQKEFPRTVYFETFASPEIYPTVVEAALTTQILEPKRSGRP